MIGTPRVSFLSGGKGAPLAWQLKCLPAEGDANNATLEAVVINCDAQTIELRLTDEVDSEAVDLSILPPIISKILE